MADKESEMSQQIAGYELTAARAAQNTFVSNYFKPFLAILSHFQPGKGSFRHLNTFPSMSRHFQPYLVMSSYLKTIPATFFFWNDLLWVCVSEAVCLLGCFPLEPMAFYILTVLVAGDTILAAYDISCHMIQV